MLNHSARIVVLLKNSICLGYSNPSNVSREKPEKDGATSIPNKPMDLVAIRP